MYMLGGDEMIATLLSTVGWGTLQVDTVVVVGTVSVIAEEAVTVLKPVVTYTNVDTVVGDANVTIPVVEVAVDNDGLMRA